MKTKRSGLTLIELVVVVAILGLLAAMLLPKFEGLQSAAGHAAAAGSAADLTRLVGAYKAAKLVYPDGYDSLMNGSTLWAPGVVGTSKGLHLELSDPTSGKLTVSSALTDPQVLAFKKVGITKLYSVSTVGGAATLRPGDMFATQSIISNSTIVPVVNTTTGAKIIDHIYRVNQQSTGTSGALPSGTQLVVLGVGPQNSMVGNSMVEVPTYGNTNGAWIYNRLLVVFEMTANKVTFKGVLGSDGDLLDDMSVNLQTTTSL